MAKRLRVSFLVVVFVSLLIGCQIRTLEQETVSRNDVIEVNDELELEEQRKTQAQEVESEETRLEDAQLEDAHTEEIQAEDVQVEEVQVEEAQAEEIQAESTENDSSGEEATLAVTIHEDGSYTSKDEVALYIHTYNKLPSNYITKKDAQEQGWNSKENTMAKVLPGKSIGGDRFGNYEGILPEKGGRSYKECDIDYVSGSRNAKRIVFSNDGLIFYTEDHYSTFEQLY